MFIKWRGKQIFITKSAILGFNKKPNGLFLSIDYDSPFKANTEIGPIAMELEDLDLLVSSARKKGVDISLVEDKP